MKKWIPAAGSVLLTLLAVVIAVVVSLHLWDYYMEAPWTRDGHVHADIIQVAPDVSGLVTELHVRDNQKVSRGQVLFVIDRARFELAVDEARATVLERRAQLDQAQREARRNRVLKDLIAAETVEIGDTQVKRAAAALATAEAALGVARVEVAPEEAILLVGRDRGHEARPQIGIAREDAAEAAAGVELAHDDADGDAGLTVFAGRAVSDVLAAPEAGLREHVVERDRLFAEEMRKDLLLVAARQIGARLRRGYVKLRKPDA